VPLHCEPIPSQMGQARLLADYFYGSKWLGWCSSGIDEETADYVDQVLRQTMVTAFLSVDRSRLADSHDSWIYVSVSDQPKEPPVTRGGRGQVDRTESGAVWRDSDYKHLPISGTAFPIFGFGPAKGVLTW